MSKTKTALTMFLGCASVSMLATVLATVAAVATVTSIPMMAEAATNDSARVPLQITAEEQSTAPKDEETTRLIRQDLMKQDLSMAAKNVTIVTTGGFIHLKGNVASQAELAKVVETARRHATNGLKLKNELLIQK
jgi:osmotically-inducible protein OsmY